MDLLLATPVGQTVPAERLGLTCAHMAYRIGTGPKLLGIRMSDSIKGGLMLLDCPNAGEDGDPTGCCSQILTECRRRGYGGIVCDFDSPPSNCIEQLIAILDRHCTAEGWSLHVPESYAPFAPAARVLISSVLTSGSLERRLHAAMERYGSSRPVLAIEWLREDLALPSDQRRGQPITQQALDEQIRQLEPAVFFDRGLCAHYYTYMAQRSQAHFVIFDTPNSIRAKLALARQLNLPAVLMAEPELRGNLDAVFA